MGEFFRKLFDTSDFPQRWHCGNWSESLGWLHIVSDLTIWIAYMGIPLVIFLVVYRKRDLPFPPLFWLFGAFIASCGIGHLIEAGIFWWPVYRVAGVVKFFTALVSIATLFALLFTLRKLMRMPTAHSLMKALQEERSTSSERIHDLFHSVFESAPCGMMLIAESGAIQQVNENASRLFGWSAEELVGRPIEDLIPHSIRARHVQMREDYFRDPSAREMAAGRDLTAIRRDGSEVPVEILLSPVDTPNGKAVISTIVDVTPRVEVEKERARQASELERRNRALDEFAYLVSHDLKAPLRAISLVSSWLQSDFGDKLGEVGAEHLATLRQRAAKMDDLIQGTLAYARAGTEQGKLESISSEKILQDVLGLLEIPEGAQVIATTALPEIVYEPNHLNNIFMNLISNALAHADQPRCTVEVACRETDDGFTFSVRDNGPGIAAKHHESIFGMFQRVNGSGDQCSGVGLAIVKTLVTRHGGEVHVESEVGTGTTFVFTVPRRLPTKEMPEVLTPTR